jgi:hypothetical protein
MEAHYRLSHALGLYVPNGRTVAEAENSTSRVGAK